MTEAETRAEIVEAVGEADVVVSDMAPNMTGEYSLDHARSVHLARQAFEVALELLPAGGDLAVEDVPEVWNDKYEKDLGVRPETDSEGCLQDIHWSHGNFGYFPTYSLGSVMAAQLFEAAEAEIDDLDAKIAEGEFDDLHDWLGENVHRHGSRYETNELVKRATGEDFSST